MKLKKCVPFLMAGLLTASGIPVSAGNYSDLEIQSLEKWSEAFSGMYQESLDEYDMLISGQTGVNNNMYLEITDTARALLGIASPVDISWLNRVGLSFDNACQGSLQAVTGSAYINETDIFTFEIYMDTASLLTYVCVPEVSPYYLKLDMSTSMDSADMEVLSLYTSDVTAFLPDGTAVKNLLNRYFTILFEHMQDGGSGETTYTVGSEEMTSAAFEGRMMEADAYAFVTELLTAAQTDEDLKALIEAWSVLDPEYGDSYYSEFQTSIQEALASLETEQESISSDDSTYISSSIWTDDEQNIIGRTISLVEAEEKTTVFQYSNLNSDTANNLYLMINSDGTALILNGSGTYTDGKLSGSYDFLVDGMSLATVTVTGYDPAALAAGALNGSFTFTLQPGSMDEETYTYLSSFDLVLDSYTDIETGASELALSVTSADVPLAALYVTAGYEEPTTIPDLNTLDPVLDPVNSEDDAITFVSELDWTPVLDNCRAAGIPEELVLALDAAITEALFGAETSAEEVIITTGEESVTEEVITIE